MKDISISIFQCDETFNYVVSFTWRGMYCMADGQEESPTQCWHKIVSFMSSVVFGG